MTRHSLLHDRTAPSYPPAHVTQRMSLRLSDRARRLAAAVVLGIYALLSIAGTSLVMCVEEDGNVALEWRSAGCCTPARQGDPASAPADPADSPAGVDARNEHPECGPCTDEPASNLLTSRGNEGQRAPSPPLPAELPALAIDACCASKWTPPATSRSAGPRTGPIPPPPWVHLRTVILLV